MEKDMNENLKINFQITRGLKLLGPGIKNRGILISGHGILSPGIIFGKPDDEISPKSCRNELLLIFSAIGMYTG